MKAKLNTAWKSLVDELQRRNRAGAGEVTALKTREDGHALTAHARSKGAECPVSNTVTAKRCAQALKRFRLNRRLRFDPEWCMNRAFAKCRNEATYTALNDQQEEYSMADLIIKLNREAADAMVTSGGSQPKVIAGILHDFDARLVAPAQDAGEARLYFRVDGVRPERIEDLRNRLAPLEGVEASYIKPSDELP
ncbi:MULTISPECIES: hypothetical protein [unclassified Ensifer]|uniref:hypothetical protein n=1 Tax=unclassified Ensifer TaxID=2633371 RepID=UPI001112AA04|nr:MULTISPECIES: hypothetical protein [unclassified Ensifer]